MNHKLQELLNSKGKGKGINGAGKAIGKLRVMAED
jgi:hypothetical protein